MDIRKITSLIFLGLMTCNAENLAGKVISINDGDTLSVLTKDNTQYKIRLNHIDAPESKQSFGSKSKQNLSNYVFGKNIIVDYKNKDRYGRILGTIIYQGNNINLMQVKDGFAWHYKQYSNAKEYILAEQEARKLKKGLWTENNPIEPWVFRKEKRQWNVFLVLIAEKSYTEI